MKKQKEKRGRKPIRYSQKDLERQPMIMIVCGETGVGKTYVSTRATHLTSREACPDLWVMEKEIQFPGSESISRSRRSSKEMFPLVRQWLDSNENQKDFCAFHRLPLAVFAYWLKKYREQSSEQPIEGTRKFAALSVRPVSSSGPLVEFPGGVKIHLPVGTSASYLRELTGQC